MEAERHPMPGRLVAIAMIDEPRHGWRLAELAAGAAAVLVLAVLLPTFVLG